VRYTSENLISEGGMGSVYSAMDNATGKTVALKLLHSIRISESIEDIVRFNTVLSAIKNIDHPNIVRVLDYGRLEAAGAPFRPSREILAGCFSRSQGYMEPQKLTIRNSIRHSHSNLIEIIISFLNGMRYLPGECLAVIFPDIESGINILLYSTMMRFILELAVS